MADCSGEHPEGTFFPGFTVTTSPCKELFLALKDENSGFAALTVHLLMQEVDPLRSVQ